MHYRGLNRTAKEGRFYYEWYELESVLVETDHTPPLAAGLEELVPNAAAEHAGQFEIWEKGVDYRLGAIRIYNCVLYRCLQSHTSKCEWKPPEISALWIKIADPSDEWPEWGQPIGAHDAYGIGDKVSHNGWKLYTEEQTV